MKKPLGWNTGKTVCHHVNIYGQEIEVKEIDGKLYSQICKHGWIYDYVEGDESAIDSQRPTPYNVKMEF